MASVTLEHVSLRYRSGAVGLADVDLQVADGEFLALVGPSGSGKTTLLRSIAGFLTPTAGRILLDDRVIAGPGVAVPPEQRQLGMVFQQHAVWPHWDVGRNVEYPLRRAKVPLAERRTRVGEALDLVGLAGYERRDPATPLRRAAATCRPGPGAGCPPPGAPAGRSALRPRRAAA
jgi:iron(III) transport system ATP-binding protein